MSVTRRQFAMTSAAGLGASVVLSTGAAQASDTALTVAYAGSMGVLMNKSIGPAFTRATGAPFQGIGEGAFALAHLIAAKTMRADVFVSITPGPIAVLQQAGLVGQAVPVASTAMVIAYSPKSRFAPELAAAAAGKVPWYQVLERKGLRFGRTDPRTDPQGRNILFTFDLAGKFYHQPDLSTRILGQPINPAQIFTEPSLLARLDAGELDATSAYESAVRSLKLPFIALPKQINLSDPAMTASWYAKAAITLELKGKRETLHTQPLVFYACIPHNAPHLALAQRFVALLKSPVGQAMFAQDGYNPPLGGVL